MVDILAQFDGYTLRSVDEERDEKRLEDWIAADRHHSGLLDPPFFLGLATDASGIVSPHPHVQCFALENKSGQTLFYIRMTRAARVCMQFPPATLSMRKRTAMGLIKGMAFLEAQLQKAGAGEWIFDSESPGLRLLASSALGFTASPNEMVRAIHRTGKEE